MLRLLLAFLVLPAWIAAARAEVPVALELVLALDRSRSIDGTMLALQLDGHAAAFRDPAVIDAITASGVRIAVTVVTWSDPNQLQTVVPWTGIASPEDARGFAALMDAAPRQAVQGSTGLGAALAEAAQQFDRNGFVSARKIIDIVSNGYSNIGILPRFARDRIVAEGITINALAILDELPWLGQYLETEVIGGPQAFVRVAADRQSFASAILDKLVLEIAGTSAPPDTVAEVPG